MGAMWAKEPAAWLLWPIQAAFIYSVVPFSGR
jgi:hypothetical protein